MSINEQETVEVKKSRAKPTPQSYKNGKIYKLMCLDPRVTDIYVGSTCDVSLNKRFQSHKRTSVRETQRNVYKFIAENGDWANWTIVLVEAFPCNCKIELTARETYWMKELGAALNSCLPQRGVKQYYEDNIDEIKRWKKQYYEENKDEISQKHKEYHKNNKDRIKKRYEQNKDRIKEQRNAKVICECGKSIAHASLFRHSKTDVHTRIMKHIEAEKLFQDECGRLGEIEL